MLSGRPEEGPRLLTLGTCPSQTVAYRSSCCVIRTLLENRMAPRLAAGHEYVLTVSCPDTPGIVYAVSSFLVQQGGNISQSQQFDDRLSEQFFMRVQFAVEDGSLADLRTGFARVAQAFQMSWQIYDAATPTRTLL